MSAPLTDYRPTPEEREPLTSGRMLVVSAFAPIVTRTTRETALARNRLVLALATEMFIPFVAEDMPYLMIFRSKRLPRESAASSFADTSVLACEYEEYSEKISGLYERW